MEAFKSTMVIDMWTLGCMAAELLMGLTSSLPKWSDLQSMPHAVVIISALPMQVLLGYPYTVAIDMWSLGCMAAELFLGLPLFPGASEHDLLVRIVEMRGVPPDHVLAKAQHTKKYFERVEELSMVSGTPISTLRYKVGVASHLRTVWTSSNLVMGSVACHRLALCIICFNRICVRPIRISPAEAFQSRSASAGQL